MARNAARLSRLRLSYHSLFGPETIIARAPGRVNLIGEHTDYNGGFVLPIAIDRDVLVAARARADRAVSVYAANLDSSTAFSLDDLQERCPQRWAEYVRGVALLLVQDGFRLQGMDVLIEGNVPIGSGLSSSAAMVTSLACAFQALNGLSLTRIELAKLGQRVENEIVGVGSGIMDQFVSLFGQRDRAVLIDCRDLTHELVPLATENVKVVVADTGVRRSLASSDYNERRQECGIGIEILRRRIPGLSSLRDVSVTMFEEHHDALPEPIRRRCEHVVRENERVLRGVEALRQGDLAGFGQLMVRSHESLRDDYEVSCRELDLMVEIALHTPGVIGARMTGAGFGGATVSLVETDAVPDFRGRVGREYAARTGRGARIFVCEAEDGAGLVYNGLH